MSQIKSEQQLDDTTAAESKDQVGRLGPKENIAIHTVFATTYTTNGNIWASGGHTSIAEKHYVAATSHNAAVEAYKAAENNPSLEAMAKVTGSNAHKMSIKADKAAFDYH